MCTATSSDKLIPPGEEGKIKVTLSTHGYGGINLKKGIKIHTNDPLNRIIHLIKIQNSSGMYYLLTVHNKRQTPGRYFDLITYRLVKC